MAIPPQWLVILICKAYKFCGVSFIQQLLLKPFKKFFNIHFKRLNFYVLCLLCSTLYLCRTLMTKFASSFSSCFPCGDLESSALQVVSTPDLQLPPRLWLVEISIDCMRYHGIVDGDCTFVLALGSGQNPSLVCLIYILLHRHGQSKIFILSKSQKF